MADPVATVEKIVKIGLKIKAAVDTVRHNEEDCNEIRRRVLRFSAILSQLQRTGMMNDSSALSGALEDLEETLQHALELVTACQERTTTIGRLVKAGVLSKKLRRVKDDILNKVMLASFAINAHTTIILFTIQTGGHPLPQQQEDARVADISHNIHSTEDARSELNDEGNTALTGSDSLFDPIVALRNFNLSELEDAISDGYVIGEGGFWKVYKCVLNNGSVVAVKISKMQGGLIWQQCHDKLLLASKLLHRNIVKVLGYGHEVGSAHEVGHSSMIMRLLKRKNDQHKNDQAQDCEYVWVEEYVPNGSLETIILSRLGWSSLSRIIEGLAQGIHYLHEQHVVYRDLKPSNILLDSEMNPKIIDFDCCLVLNADENEITDDRVVGTFGYMPPEYAFHGIVSVKIDVFAFGVILLRTVSTMYVSSDSDSDLPSSSIYDTRAFHAKAWNAWENGRMEGLFDPSLFDGSDQLMEAKRCTQIGLLCTQSERADRPTMADVLAMLHGEMEMPVPKKPTYFKVPDGEESDEEDFVVMCHDSPSACLVLSFGGVVAEFET
ncbi:hypothetical protein U9M48_001232 [Paspalum notatum var. saurae]|uniref:non-specific serine/threonine protein kinase n=1 Tax=Paspalum notatum var. saurae TaxID=547442 RepID=A0AAQ3PHZ6_PASNO